MAVQMLRRGGEHGGQRDLLYDGTIEYIHMAAI